MSSTRHEQQDTDPPATNGPITQLTPEPAHPRSAISTHNNDPEADESSPLLERSTSTAEQNGPSRPKRSWWTIISIAILLVITVNIIVFAFVIPSATENYAAQATTYQLQNIEIQNFTDDGIISRAQVNITIDASRVPSRGIRNIGLFGTNIFKHVYTKACNVSILLPQYNGAQVAFALLPPLTIDVRNMHVNVLNIVTNVTITDETVAVQLARDILSGKRHEIETIGETDVDIKAGIIPLGRHHIRQQVVVKGNTPKLPEYTIEDINIIDTDDGTSLTSTVDLVNEYPVTIDVPGLKWRVFVPGCTPTERIRLADAETGAIEVRKGNNITLDVHSLVTSLPQKLLDPCSEDAPSPLEVLFQSLVDPLQNTTIFISGHPHQASSDGNMPKWLPNILSSLSVPIPIPHLETNTSDLISSIHLSEMKFTLPPPWAPPGSPNSQPKISGLVEAVIKPPVQAKSVDINVTAVKADVLLFDKGQKFGRVVVPEWSPATTTRKEMIHVLARVSEVPVEVLDPFVFQRVMGKVLQGGGTVEIGVEGTVDGQVTVLIGEFAIRGIPVKGVVEVQGISPYQDLKLALVGDLNVVETTKNSISIAAGVKVKNPTQYQAFVPYLNLHLMYEGYLIGNATAVNATVTNGTNIIQGTVTYGPTTSKETEYAEKFLGEYLSGNHPNITVLFHNSSIPGNPTLSSALAGLNITLPVPSIHPPPDSTPAISTTKKHHSPSPFLRSATVHLLSRTAQFQIYNPLQNSPITISSLWANATYQNEIIGTILEPDFDFEVLAGSEGLSETDKIPVEVGSVGYDVIRKALGGELVVDAIADVVARIGEWRGRIRYCGQGLGASVRL